MLETAIKSLRCMSRPVQIVVQDNGSTDPSTLETLERLSREGVDVFYGKAIQSADELNKLNDTVQAFFTDRPTANYVVSDCDIDISIADPRALEVYTELLNLLPHVACVGPMLRIRDIPTIYPLFNRVMNRHIEQFWKSRPRWIETSVGRVAYIEAPIDTTLALHRAGESFYRKKMGARVYEPYEARHLDWYLGAGEMSAYAHTSSNRISHWNNKIEFERFRDVALEYQSFFAVRAKPDGSIEEYIERVGRSD